MKMRQIILVKTLRTHRSRSVSVGVLLRRSKLRLGVADKPLVGAASRREEKDSAMPEGLYSGSRRSDFSLRLKT